MAALFVILASESEVDGHVLFSFYIVFRLWNFVHGLMHIISSTFRSDNFTTCIVYLSLTHNIY